MAKRGRSDRGQRDDNSLSLETLLALTTPIQPFSPLPSLAHVPSQRSQFNEIEDGRRFVPGPSRSRLFAGSSAPLKIGSKRPSQRGPATGVAFASPVHTVRCVRRKERREVIFALRKRGKGAAARRRRRNYWSNVSC